MPGEKIEKIDEEILVGKCPVGLRTLRSSELRKVGTTPVPGGLEGGVGGHGRLEAMCLRPNLRRIESGLRCAMYRGWRGGNRCLWCLLGVEDWCLSREPWGRKRLEGAILCVLEQRILRDGLLLNWRVGWRNGLERALSEPGLALHPLDQFRKSDPGLRVDIKDSLQHGIALIGDGQDGLEEVGILPVGLVGRVLNRCALPRIAAACQVDKNHTQGPHIVRC